MDYDGEINIREEIVQIVGFLVEFLNRFRDRGAVTYERWRLALLRGGDHSIVRWIGDNLPNRAFIDLNIYNNYNMILEYIFSERSLVREIGSRLPLQPCKRPYFYMLHKPCQGERTKSKSILGGRFVQCSTPRPQSTSPDSMLWTDVDESCRIDGTFNQSGMVMKEDAVRKITALEDELNRLRSQIAGFVLHQDIPAMQGLPPLTPPDTIIPAPPPPPPLPACTTTSKEPCSESSQAKTNTNKASFKECATLDMTAILKDLSQVKLKAVERSPGGTPMRRAPLKTKGTDPASIIADALKSKFAKSRVVAASPDKENITASDSPVNSFSNTPSPQPYFRKPDERRFAKTRENEATLSPLAEMTNRTPLRV